MRATLISGIAILLAGSALAQPAAAPSPGGAAAPQATRPAEPQANVPPAGSPAGAAGQVAPSIGANTITEAQAKTRIEAQGYTGVTALQKDANGMWRGKAMKDGKSVDLSLDTEGKVTVR